MNFQVKFLYCFVFVSGASTLKLGNFFQFKTTPETFIEPQSIDVHVQSSKALELQPETTTVEQPAQSEANPTKNETVWTTSTMKMERPVTPGQEIDETRKTEPENAKIAVPFLEKLNLPKLPNLQSYLPSFPFVTKAAETLTLTTTLISQVTTREVRTPMCLVVVDIKSASCEEPTPKSSGVDLPDENFQNYKLEEVSYVIKPTRAMESLQTSFIPHLNSLLESSLVEELSQVEESTPDLEPVQERKMEFGQLFKGSPPPPSTAYVTETFTVTKVEKYADYATTATVVAARNCVSARGNSLPFCRQIHYPNMVPLDSFDPTDIIGAMGGSVVDRIYSQVKEFAAKNGIENSTSGTPAAAAAVVEENVKRNSTTDSNSVDKKEFAVTVATTEKLLPQKVSTQVPVVQVSEVVDRDEYVVVQPQAFVLYDPHNVIYYSDYVSAPFAAEIQYP